MMDWVFVALGVLLTVGTAIFVSAEFSFVALDPSTVERRASAGDTRATSVANALHHLSTHLSGAQVGITLTTVLLGYTTQVALARILRPLLGDLVGETTATGLAVTVAFVLVNAFSMLFGELIPKNIALADPLRAAGLVVTFQKVFTTAFRPIIAALNTSANTILGWFNIEPSEELSGARSSSELAALVRHSAEEGTLDVGTATLLTRSIGIGALQAIDVMTDRGRVHTLQREDSAADVVALARETGHSRFPVVDGNMDDVLGFVHLRRAIAVPFERRADVPVVASSLMAEAPRVPETMPLAPLLVELRSEGLQMAVVVDEYGGTSGIVTLEDVVEEIVGDVADEHDRRRQGARSLKGGVWMVPGVLRPDELAEQAGLQVPDDGPYETLGGLIMDRLSKIPEAGDEIQVGDVHLAVERMDGRRVERIRVWSTSPELNAGPSAMLSEGGTR
ncbi:MAG: hemolysin family protein [Bowdeniella nasicola]|nr:hemolysin family protein [Bowdeniella nasicola]